MNQPEFCCDMLSEMASEAGRKGFSVLMAKMKTEEKYYFVLQCRSADFDSYGDKAFVSQIAIHYCPWCGSKLADVITTQPEAVEKMEKSTRHLTL